MSSDTYHSAVRRSREIDRTSEFEDDGALHIVRFGYRACFVVSESQDHPKRQNELTRRILNDLGIDIDGDRVFVDEDSEHDDTCGEYGGTVKES
jgi:hypothetical protein